MAHPRFPLPESEARGVFAAIEMSTEVWRRVLIGEWSMRVAF